MLKLLLKDRGSRAPCPDYHGFLLRQYALCVDRVVCKERQEHDANVVSLRLVLLLAQQITIHHSMRNVIGSELGELGTLRLLGRKRGWSRCAQPLCIVRNELVDAESNTMFARGFVSAEARQVLLPPPENLSLIHISE